MALRYHVYAQSLSREQFAELRENLEGWAFGLYDIASSAQALDVVVNDVQDWQELISAFPVLKKCEIVNFQDNKK